MNKIGEFHSLVEDMYVAFSKAEGAINLHVDSSYFVMPIKLQFLLYNTPRITFHCVARLFVRSCKNFFQGLLQKSVGK